MTRIIVIDSDLTQRRLIIAQVQEQTGWNVNGAATIRDALTLKLALAQLIILDWSNLALSEVERDSLRVATKGVPLVVLARRDDRARIERFYAENVTIMYRPFTIGDVVSQAQELLKGKLKHG